MSTHSGDAQTAYSKTVRLFDAIDTIIFEFVIELGYLTEKISVSLIFFYDTFKIK